MRLLKRKGDGEFSLTEFLKEDEIPAYAILSHTWGAEEVTFKDLIENTGKSKADGYNKLQFCGEQAERDGFEYFWVDTCCIDKASSAELTEAINSMFRWYRNAGKCYVYLSDVSKSENDRDDLSLTRWEPAFRGSRWFTRGWTLQELIAPARVEFFSSERIWLGDKESMKQQIHEITGIPIRAIQGHPLSDFSVPERMSWAKERNTTRQEDKAYSLFGVFDVHLPLIYGEGKEKAFVRLREQIEKGKPEDAARMKIHQWLSPPDPSLNYQKALKQRQADTGLWFVESEQYGKWKTDPTSFLWLHGIPGCGKTILSSTVLENVFQYCADDPTKVVAYFYFDFNDTQKQVPELMVRSLVSQISQQCVEIPPALESLFSACKNKQQQLSLDNLLEVLYQMILGFPQSYIVLDALDESAHRPELMEILQGIAQRQHRGLHLLVTSRREQDIERTLEILVPKHNIICLQTALVDMDIRNYVNQRLSTDKNLKRWKNDASVVDEIESAIMKGAHGMFRWAACQLDALTKCLSRTMLRKALTHLPPTLDTTYERILTSIEIEYSEYALRILQWLAFSARPLSVEEAAEALAIDVKRDPAFDTDEVLEDPLDLLKICSSLITITETEQSDSESLISQSGRKVVLLAHYSVKEYLTSERIFQGPAARYSMQAAICNDFIAKSCLGYLLQFRQPDSVCDKTLQDSKLAQYSAEFWITHAQAAGKETQGLTGLIVEFFTNENGAYLNWARIYDPEKERKTPNFEKMLDYFPTPLYYASQSGLSATVKLLLSKGAEVNAQGRGRYNTALQAASAEGYITIVELLINKGADVNAPGRVYNGTALQVASAEGYITIVELLLNKGARVNAQRGRYSNALQAASQGGHTAIVELLLNKGADVNAQGRGYGNALQAASGEGHTAIVELLLNKGARVNAQRGIYSNALQAASQGGHMAIVEFLLNKGADVNAQGGYYGNALQAASQGGHIAIVELLLNKGADVNAQGGRYNNALQAASQGGHTAIVELLLSKGAKA